MFYTDHSKYKSTLLDRTPTVLQTLIYELKDYNETKYSVFNSIKLKRPDDFHYTIDLQMAINGQGSNGSARFRNKSAANVIFELVTLAIKAVQNFKRFFACKLLY